MLCAVTAALVLFVPSAAQARTAQKHPQHAPPPRWHRIYPGQAQQKQHVSSINMTAVRRLRVGVGWARARTWHWQDAAGTPRTRAVYEERHTVSVRYLRWLGRLWHGRRLVARVFAAAHPRETVPWAFWDCVATGVYPGRGRVSSGEGGATSVNWAGPWFGRYQMDRGFMQRWGAEMLRKHGGRDARSWTVAEQTEVAERGFHGQGPMAWPNTAPPCLGLR